MRKTFQTKADRFRPYQYSPTLVSSTRKQNLKKAQIPNETF